jgi:vacuolar-type H+-ATPase subunit E/Vma4
MSDEAVVPSNPDGMDVQIDVNSLVSRLANRIAGLEVDVAQRTEIIRTLKRQEETQLGVIVAAQAETNARAAEVKTLEERLDTVTAELGDEAKKMRGDLTAENQRLQAALDEALERISDPNKAAEDLAREV